MFMWIYESLALSTIFWCTYRKAHPHYPSCIGLHWVIVAFIFPWWLSVCLFAVSLIIWPRFLRFTFNNFLILLRVPRNGEELELRDVVWRKQDQNLFVGVLLYTFVLELTCIRAL